MGRKRMRRQVTDEGKIFAKDIVDREDCYPKHTKNFWNSAIRKWTAWLKHGQKTWTGTSPKKIYTWWISTWDDGPPHVPLQNCKIKRTKRCRYTPIRMVKIQNTHSSKSWWGCGARELSLIAAGNAKWYNHFGRLVGSVL